MRRRLHIAPRATGKSRENRTIKDCARTILIAADLPQFLWAEAVSTTVFVHNRVLDTQSPDITAFEAIFKKIPSVGHLRVFGCTAYAHIPDPKRKAFDPKSTKMVLVGYCGENKYRLYNEATNEIHDSRNVTFCEEKEEYVELKRPVAANKPAVRSPRIKIIPQPVYSSSSDDSDGHDDDDSNSFHDANGAENDADDAPLFSDAETTESSGPSSPPPTPARSDPGPTTSTPG
ncbi:unnamed protein product [Allacma fusca]|uniref:Retroviral polymerase SH3-like domain-containing protein n=1 Tax=Allacma fusca TaxID=39272 RepID=A0A8J2JRF9_9HEXA|nr:unnamed protein product [Allacma fusca]